MTTTEPDTIETMLPAERRAVGVIALIGMLRMFGLFALLPVLSLYAAELESATPILIGLAVGAYGLTQAGLQIPLGALSDRIGRVPVIVGGLAVFALGSVLAAFSDTIYGVIAGRLLQGAGAISATLTALIADATRDGVRTRSMAVFGIGVGGAFLMAMMFGPLFSARYGVPALFLFAAFLALAAAALLVALPRDVEKPDTPREWNFKAAFRPELLRVDIYVFLLHAILTASFVALPFLFVDRLELAVTEILTASFVALPFLFVDRLELAVTDHWKMYVGALLLSLTGTIPLILRDERQGKGSTIGIAVTLLLVGQLVLTFAGFAVASVFAGLVLFFAGFNFLEAGLPARLSLIADDESRGASLGVFASAQFLGAFVGGLIGGRFLAAGRPSDVFFVCVLLAAIWLALQSFGRFRTA
jgi:MFS family permease